MKRRSNKITFTFIYFAIISIFASCVGTSNTIDYQINNTESEGLIFKNETGLELNVSQMEDIAFGFVHTGEFSPDYEVQIKAEEIEFNSFILTIKTQSKTYSIESLSVSPISFSWSSSGRYVVIHNIDYYAGEGSTGIVVLNVQTGHFIEINKDQIIGGREIGKRDKLNIYNIVWLDLDRFSLVASVGYLGESGHPGIDSNRKTYLGEFFGNKDDIVLVANWDIKILND
ncbi:MAG: hypothetical protein OCD02_21430 [Spirochaetaceae bacterium]